MSSHCMLRGSVHPRPRIAAAARARAVAIIAATAAAFACIADVSAAGAGQARAVHEREAAARAALGTAYAGGWLESRGGGETVFVAAHAGDDAAVVARVAAIPGVEVRRVRHSLAALDASMRRLDALIARPMIARLPQLHSWRIDPRSNSVVVTLDPDALDTGIDFVAASGADAATIRFETSPHRPQPAAGGQLIGGNRVFFAGGGSCTTGFNVTKPSGRYSTTAGHCAPAVGTDVLSLSGEIIGVVYLRNYPGADWAVIRITNPAWTNPPWVAGPNGGVIVVAGYTPATIGQTVCRSGPVTGYRCGTIRARNVTVNYGAGAVTGLTETSACAGSGDSGGPFLTPSAQAQGMLSGGAFGAGGTNCTSSSPRTWFQPINPVIAAIP